MTMLLRSFFFSSLEEEAIFHQRLCIGMIILSPITFVFLRYVFPPSWGKNFHSLLGGLTIPPKIGWCLFEIPNLYWAVLCYYFGDDNQQSSTPIPATNLVLLMLFVGHYINRSIIYPLTLNSQSKPLPLEIALSAFAYTNINGYIQSRSLCQFYSPSSSSSSLSSPRFFIGLILFAVGAIINWQSDHILRNLRKNKNTKNNSSNSSGSGGGYVIPYGGLFQYVSAPHYFGEIIEWIGFAIAAESYAGWSFATFTCANLIPRALVHHEWYQQHFKDYPLERKAVIPFVW